MQQQRLEAGVPGGAEALFGQVDDAVEALAELVLRRLGVGVADGPETLNEGVALIRVPEFAEHAALRVGEDRVDGLEEVGVAPVERRRVLGGGHGDAADEEKARAPALPPHG